MPSAPATGPHVGRCFVGVEATTRWVTAGKEFGNDVAMGRLRKVILSVLLVVVGVVGCVVFLTGQGLDQAEKWVSIVGTVASLLVGMAGLAVGWLAWQRPVTSPRAGPPMQAPSASPAGSFGKYVVIVQEPRAMQVGEGNTQHNTFP